MHKVYSATSKDEINFITEPGARFEAKQLTDPEVIFYKNQWYLYYSVGTESKLATSTDGLTFKEQQITGGEVGGVPGALITSDGGVRLFGCGKGLSTALSPDGINFKKEQENIIDMACDPAAVKSAQGGYAMVYKIRGKK